MLEVIEGRWEDVVSRGAELAGKQVRVEVLPEPRNGTGQPVGSYATSLQALSQLRSLERTAAEIEVLEGFEAFQQAK